MSSRADLQTGRSRAAPQYDRSATVAAPRLRSVIGVVVRMKRILRAGVRGTLRGFLALALPFAVSVPAGAAQPIRIAVGFGLAFLPVYICEDLKLIEKQARMQHLDVRVSYQRFDGAGPIEAAIASRAIDLAPYGTAPLLIASRHGINTPQQVFAVSGMTTLPLVLLSNRSNVHTLADLQPSDRIAMPNLSAPQMYFLEMASEAVFGRADRLRRQVLPLSHAKALAALVSGGGPVTAYFSSPPYTRIALKDPHIHPILRSEQVVGGKASFLVIGATRAYILDHPKIPQLIDAAMDEAAALIRTDPRRAAQIYLTHEPSGALNVADIEAVLRRDGNEFGSAVEGIAAFAAFMGRDGELRNPPQSWKDVVAPALLNSPSS